MSKINSLEEIPKDKELCPDCSGTGESSTDEEDEVHALQMNICSTCKGKGYIDIKKEK